MHKNPRIAALEAQLSARTGAKVKALEWEKHPVAEAWRAYTLVGVYQVWNGHTGVSCTFEGVLDERINGPGQDIEQAKAAAQADFERRIFSALEPAAMEARGHKEKQG